MNFQELYRSLQQASARVQETIDLGMKAHHFPAKASSPLYSQHCLINKFLAEIPDPSNDKPKPAAFSAGRRILEAPEEELLAIIEAMMAHRVWIEYRGFGKPNCGWLLRNIAHQLWRRDLAYTPSRAANLVSIIASQLDDNGQFDDDMVPVFKICESLKEKDAITPELEAALKKLQTSLTPGWNGALRKKARDIIDRLVHSEKLTLDAGEAWSNVCCEDLKQMPSEVRNAWNKLFSHCLETSTSKPTQKWSNAAQALLAGIGKDRFKASVICWFELVAMPRPIHRPAASPLHPDPDLQITDRNASVLKGLAWVCAGWKNDELTRSVSRLAETCFKKVRNLGARCPRVGNACLYSLSVTSTDEAASQLSRLNQTVKQPSAKKLVGKSLDKAAELSGQTREDLEESTIPTYGLDADGRCRQSFGEFTAEFSILGSDAFEMTWRKADGKSQKSVPAEVKEKCASELKAFKRTLQDIEKMLPAQRRRIERLLMTQREWDLETWRKRYLNQPLLADLTRKLIWHFKLGDQTGLGIWLNGKLVDVRDQSLDWLAPETRVRLWHPLGFPIETVAAWREWLLAHHVCQPFKQAHREIYILTDAELQTGTYSNRFAAHILRQHQFTALAKDRGWAYNLMGNFDSHNVPTLVLPQWNLAVEFWVEGQGGRENLSDMGILLYVGTDQVRFIRDTQALLLSDVPAIVFSEVMRDVDLFVGVASIGSDPAWQDNGEIQGGAAYWHNFSFGALNASAKTRKEVLERLLPKLKIAPQCSFDDKFLVVKGSLRTYKIHLGSGNIQMEPNNQYLCIVADRGAAVKGGSDLFLPFDGDRTLSVILSKAFMLAEDTKIKDSSIMSQIRLKA
jgi:hypothetical protein